MPSGYLILLLILFFVGSAQSQSIRVEHIEGQLSVNGEPIRSNALPEELDLGKAEFSLQSSGTFPMRVEVNGTSFEIWQDRVTKAKMRGPVSFKLVIDPNESYATIESGEPDVNDLMEMVSQHMTGVVSAVPAMKNDLRNMIETIQDSYGEIVSPSYGMASSLQGATRMLELSSYLTNVQNAGGDLFELLKREWHMEVKVGKMARRIRTLEDGEERDDAIEQLREKLEDIFLMKQENRRMEIQHLEIELERMEKRLKERSKAMDRLIDARVDELLETRE